MADRAGTSTTARRAAATTTSATDRRAAAAAASSSTPVPTTPPTGARFITDGPGQSYSVFASAVTLATPRRSTSGGSATTTAPAGVWAATVGVGSSSAVTLNGVAAAGNEGSTAASTKSKFPIIPVAAGAGGGFILLVVTAVLICCCVKRRKAKQRESFNLRTQNLRNSLISPPVTSDKYGTGTEHYNYVEDYRAPSPISHYEPPRQDHSSFYAPTPPPALPSPRLGGLSAQDRGYGSRATVGYRR